MLTMFVINFTLLRIILALAILWEYYTANWLSSHPQLHSETKPRLIFAVKRIASAVELVPIYIP